VVRVAVARFVVAKSSPPPPPSFEPNPRPAIPSLSSSKSPSSDDDEEEDPLLLLELLLSLLSLLSLLLSLPLLPLLRSSSSSLLLLLLLLLLLPSSSSSLSGSESTGPRLNPRLLPVRSGGAGRSFISFRLFACCLLLGRRGRAPMEAKRRGRLVPQPDKGQGKKAVPARKVRRVSPRAMRLM
jgi:hypothetical protein